MDTIIDSIIGQYWRLCSIEQQLALKKVVPIKEESYKLPKKKDPYMINVLAYNSQTIYLNTQKNVYQTGWKEKTIVKSFVYTYKKLKIKSHSCLFLIR